MLPELWNGDNQHKIIPLIEFQDQFSSDLVFPSEEKKRYSAKCSIFFEHEIKRNTTDFEKRIF